MSEPGVWPTIALTDNGIPGELAWPEGTILEASSQCNNPFGLVDVGRGAHGTRFEKSEWEGLRGTFSTRQARAVENVDNIQSLRVYRLWHWAGTVGIELGDEEERDLLHMALTGTDTLVGPTSLYRQLFLFYWDGITQDDQGRPWLTRYYEDNQGGRSGANPSKIGDGWYEMRSDKLVAKEEAASIDAIGATSNPTMDSLIGDRSAAMHAALKGVGSQNFATAKAADVYPMLQLQQEVTPTVEKQEGGIAETEKSFVRAYAEDLAWVRLRRNNLHSPRMSGVPLISQYQAMRRSMLNAASIVLRDSKGRYHTNNPDRMQSEINGNIRDRLKTEGFADHWIDFFMTKENVNTITPAGFSLRSDPALRGSGISGFSSGVLTTGILAGTDPSQIMDVKATPVAESPFQPEPPAPVKIVIRAPFGYIKPGGGSGSGVGDSFDRPQLVQWFPKNYKYATWTLRTLDTNTRASEKYIFDYAPNEVQYQGLGAEWVEVPRTGDLPLVEFSKWSLMRVTMQFLIANNIVDDLGRPHPDGLVTGVYDKIEKLRTMAQRPFPVSALNIDQLLRISMKRAMVSGEPLEFVISDFSITSMQRTIVAGSNEITAAQCSLTLQEIPIEATFKSKFKRPIVSVPAVTPSEETMDSVIEISVLAPETSQSGTEFEPTFATNADDLDAVGVGPNG